MRVCHLIGSLKYGGAERQYVNILNTIEAEARFAFFLTEKLSPNILYERLSPEIKILTTPFRTRYFYYYIFKIARLLRKERVDVLQTHMYEANLLGSISGKIAGVPAIITTEHGKNPWKKKWHYFVERQIISPLVDRRICVSKDILNTRKKMDKIKPNKLIYIPNGINPIPEPPPKGKIKTAILGSVGRLIEAKGFDTLIEACALLKKNRFDYHLYIIGDGPLRKKLEKIIKQIDLGNNITVTGFQDNIDEWMRFFDIFVIASKREGQPIVLLEAMAHGLPIVATRVGGIPETVEHDAEALLVNPESPYELFSAIMDLRNNKTKRTILARNARKKLENEFSIQACCRLHLHLYNNILKSKHGIVSR